jgi:hypothetical protein
MAGLHAILDSSHSSQLTAITTDHVNATVINVIDQCRAQPLQQQVPVLLAALQCSTEMLGGKIQR